MMSHYLLSGMLLLVFLDPAEVRSAEELTASSAAARDEEFHTLQRHRAELMKTLMRIAASDPGPDDNALADAQLRAIVLLGEYRCAEAADLLVDRVTADFPWNVVDEFSPLDGSPAALALVRIGDPAFKSILRRLQDGRPVSDREIRIFSLVVSMHIDDQEVASFRLGRSLEQESARRAGPRPDAVRNLRRLIAAVEAFHARSDDIRAGAAGSVAIPNGPADASRPGEDRPAPADGRRSLCSDRLPHRPRRADVRLGTSMSALRPCAAFAVLVLSTGWAVAGPERPEGSAGPSVDGRGSLIEPGERLAAEAAAMTARLAAIVADERAAAPDRLVTAKTLGEFRSVESIPRLVRQIDLMPPRNSEIGAPEIAIILADEYGPTAVPELVLAYLKEGFTEADPGRGRQIAILMTIGRSGSFELARPYAKGLAAERPETRKPEVAAFLTELRRYERT